MVVGRHIGVVILSGCAGLVLGCSSQPTPPGSQAVAMPAAGAGTAGVPAPSAGGASGSGQVVGGAGNTSVGAAAGSSGAAAAAGTGGSDPGTAGTTMSDPQEPPQATAGSGGATPDAPAIALPDGSREFEGIVNLVDAEAAAEVATLIRGEAEAQLVFVRTSLILSANLFLQHYLDEYDFLLFFTDYQIEDATVAGVFSPVTSPAAPGAGNDFEIEAPEYRTDGRLKGAIGFNYRPGIGPPMGHELMHYWANHLDPSFGFGEALDQDYGPHWGFSSVNGQLGGFDEATLMCETPAGAVPPDCTPLDSGRTRYIVGNFAPNSNVFRDVPYSPLELYLMGLIGPDEVPQSFTLLQAAQQDEASFEDDATETVIVEADGISQVTLADIIARHGQVELRPAEDRSFTSAVIVVSEAPASDEVLAEVASWAADFGNRQNQLLSSFETLTGGRATLSTLLGRRRTEAEPVSEPRQRFECDVLAQDCKGGLSCYVLPPTYCALSQGIGLDEPCADIHACAPGLDCVAGDSNPDVYVCKPYCDPSGAGEKSCQALCPDDTNITIQDTSTGQLWGLCVPE